MQQELHRSASEALSEGFTSFFTTTDSTANKSLRGRESGDDTAVFARNKRNHHRRTEETSTGDSSGTSAGKRVRIQETLQHQQSGAGTADQQHEQRFESKHQSRVVTDVSGSSTGLNNSSSAGSGGNSNVGTSSSGNDAGGKSGSSEELGTKEEEEDGSNDNSEATASGNENPKESLSTTNSGLQQAATVVQDAHKHLVSGMVNNSENQYGAGASDGAVRVRKLQDKKRKRIEMRREYEAQQQFDSCETSEVNEQYFKPGKPVLMENVVVFSKIPR